ncbi:MAG: hypothetical protein AAGC93_13205 [Cyanobacteria bacterium P01_F01_bin.53]
MSDNQPPKNSSEPQEIASQGNMDGHSSPSTGPVSENSANDAVENQAQLELVGVAPDVSSPNAVGGEKAGDEKGDSATDSDWEPLDLPGTLNLEASESAVESDDESDRETELLTLIHDLNECNDVLLSRVSHLEGELEKSQATLKNEVEKAAFAQDKMAKQVNAEQASAQQVAQNAQQQVSKLVSQLETSEQALSRQQLISENLQTELANSQERVTQLERESALASQQHAEEAKARVKAETTSRDLRSRLHRQQRYTLQFKAALEKSLTVSTRQANTYSNAVDISSPDVGRSVAQPVSFNDPAANKPAAVTMPKAQRIMPWAAGATAFQGIDPHLETLIRSAGKPAVEQPAPSAPILTEPTRGSVLPVSNTPGLSNQPAAAPDLPTDPEAEAKLWQDLERVMNTSSTDESAIEKPAENAENPVPVEMLDRLRDGQAGDSKTGENKSPEASSSKAQVTANPVKSKPIEFKPSEPKLNWQEAVVSRNTPAVTAQDEPVSDNNAVPEAAKKDAGAQGVTKVSTVLETIKGIAKESVKAAIPKQSTASAPPAKKATKPESGFTEPSPWGKPLPGQTSEPVSPAVSATLKSPKKTAKQPVELDYLPAVDAATASKISPVVKPLRTQKKKVSSMSAVELPTFQTAKAGSFKR